MPQSCLLAFFLGFCLRHTKQSLRLVDIKRSSAVPKAVPIISLWRIETARRFQRVKPVPEAQPFRRCESLDSCYWLLQTRRQLTLPRRWIRRTNNCRRTGIYHESRPLRSNLAMGWSVRMLVVILAEEPGVAINLRSADRRAGHRGQDSQAHPRSDRGDDP